MWGGTANQAGKGGGGNAEFPIQPTRRPADGIFRFRQPILNMKTFRVQGGKATEVYNDQPSRYSRCKYRSASGALGIFISCGSHWIRLPLRIATLPSKTTSVIGPE